MIRADALRKGDVIKAPWREHGDDQNLTGTILSVTKHGVKVRWNGDGDTTPEGDESTLFLAEKVERAQ